MGGDLQEPLGCLEMAATPHVSGTGRNGAERGAEYGFDERSFREALERHAAGEGSPEVIGVHATRRLGVLYGFVGTQCSDGLYKVRCFRESDSVLRKAVVEYGKPRVLDGREDKAISEAMRGFIQEAEVEEGEFARPCRRGVWPFRGYANPLSFDTWSPRFMEVGKMVRWLFTSKKQDVPPRAEIEAVLGVERPCFGTDEQGVSFTWLGHASVLVRLNGVNVLTDPVFGRRAFSLPWVGPKRHVDPPCLPEDLPRIDIVVISHDHHDHLDMDSVRRISACSPGARWYVPQGVEGMLRGVASNVRAMEWGEGEDEELEIAREGAGVGSFKRLVTVACVPSQHWGGRYLYDTCTRLWSGWVVSVGGKAFYYAGDTGFCKKEFLKIGRTFDVLLAAIPIGCYEPSWFMHPQHISPGEAVAVHEMVGAETSVAVHWGTYDMGSSEGFLSPKKDLEAALRERGVEDGRFMAVPPGRTVRCRDRLHDPPSQ